MHIEKRREKPKVEKPKVQVSKSFSKLEFVENEEGRNIVFYDFEPRGLTNKVGFRGVWRDVDNAMKLKLEPVHRGDYSQEL